MGVYKHEHIECLRINLQKKNKYCNLITKMKHKITLYGAKNEELTIERDALK